jgi:hypothetical protein
MNEGPGSISASDRSALAALLVRQVQGQLAGRITFVYCRLRKGIGGFPCNRCIWKYSIEKQRLFTRSFCVSSILCSHEFVICRDIIRAN